FGACLKAEDRRTRGAVQQLEDLLQFDEYPIERIEAFDISNTFGSQSVGSMVVFEGGKPKNSDYRKFKIQTVVGPDDYASMEEVLRRRFTHALEEIRQLSKEGKDPSLGSFTKLPDLILMDGGRGQVNIALKVLEEVGLEIPVAGMVKDDHHRTRGLYYENEEIEFGKNREAFHLITRIQDEAHRFAISFHRKLRTNDQIRSVLDQIPGIGDARRKALLREFGSVDTIRDLSVEELRKADGMNRPAAEAVYYFFHSRKEAVTENGERNDL
ncbi:MAG: excinuclease ABC subunit C, partial [Firmicutes bacterium]|nr:excinuclease ABC subunit C [Bacillota bacterium]